MTRDDIVRMAREAGIRLSKDVWPWEGEAEESMEHFANLIAAAEREACARVCDEFSDPIAKGYLRNVAVKIKAAIRARGERD